MQFLNDLIIINSMYNVAHIYNNFASLIRELQYTWCCIPVFSIALSSLLLSVCKKNTFLGGGGLNIFSTML